MSNSVKCICFLVLLTILLSACKTRSVEVATQALDPTKAILAHEIKAELGEGAFWHHQAQVLYWVDIEGKKLHLYNPSKGINQSFDTPSRIGTVVPSSESEAMVALEDGIHILNTTSGKLSLFSEIESDNPNNRMNDGKCDPSGRLWVGSMHLPQTSPEGKVYMVESDGSANVMIDSVTISNGIVWTKDTKTMYYIDTPTGYVRAYDFDNATGAITNERKVIEVPESEGFPDGMTIDENDKLWIGLWNGNKVAQYDPLTGKMISSVVVPAHNVTACAFGGPDLDTLYITTARVDMSKEELDSLPLSGSIFKAVPGVKGVPSNHFKK